MRFTFDIEGIEKFEARLARLNYSLGNMQPYMTMIGRKSATYFSTVAFASQGGVFGDKWPRLSPKYAAIKARLYPGRPPLVRSGKMQDSFGFRATGTGVEVTNNVRNDRGKNYFVYHQSTKERHKIPRRATMGINDPIRQLVHDILSQGVSDKIRST